MQVVYIVGAQCTGKTTLSKAIFNHLATHSPKLKCQVLCETARSTLRSHSFTREDVREGGERCLLLQSLILDSQLEREKTAREGSWDLLVSDRSGIDPLVYAHMYCETALFKRLEDKDSWIYLKSTMGESTIIVCEPVEQWLFDDGIRLVPLDWEEWLKTHDVFQMLLRKHEIQHVVLPAAVRDIESRIDFVLAQIRTKIGNTADIDACRELRDPD